uniref:Myb-like domain-containing protein n=1 Tax=Brassica oleracea var. oleracea TaxID=109376 RepID=A0A0D3CYX6_BRAOL
MDFNPFTETKNFVDLLSSQQNLVFGTDTSPQVPFYGSQATEDSNFGDNVLLISSWLNTSKDAVVGNEQTFNTFWTRIATYYNVSPQAAGSEKREPRHCKNRWQKINDLVCKFCGAFEAATREKTSGQNENDVLKLSHHIIYTNHKKKFTLEHAWKELRNDQKGCEGSTAKTDGNSKKRKCGDVSQSASSKATEADSGDDDEATTRPPRVKATKARSKKTMDEGKKMSQFQTMWSLKQQDLVFKERSHSRAKPHKKDGLGRLGLSTLQKCTAAIRVLAYDSALDAVDEYLKLGATTTRLCVKIFMEAIIDLFGDQYLRRPTPDDHQRLLYIGELRGFPGMIGSIDCMHWEWKNCLTAWKMQYSRGSGKPTIVLQVVASYDLWIWHAFFGPPGTLNDINVLDRSPVFDDIINGQIPQVNFSVNGREYHLAYYLTDGIYPKWATFIQSIQLPQGPKADLFAQCQEAARKDVERAFGVLQARFAIVKNPALSWDKVKIEKIMRACIILHNMIVENKRDDYTQYDVSGFQQGEGSRSSHVDLTYFTNIPTNITNQMGVRTRICDRQAHKQLKCDLVEHIWRKFRRDQDNN